MHTLRKLFESASVVPLLLAVAEAVWELRIFWGGPKVQASATSLLPMDDLSKKYSKWANIEDVSRMLLVRNKRASRRSRDSRAYFVVVTVCPSLCPG